MRNKLRPFIDDGEVWAKVIDIECNKVYSDIEENGSFTVTLDILNNRMKKKDEMLHKIINEKDFEDNEELTKEFIENYMYISFMKIEVDDVRVIKKIEGFNDDWFKLKIIDIDKFMKKAEKIIAMIGKNNNINELYKQVIIDKRCIMNANKNWVMRRVDFFG